MHQAHDLSHRQFGEPKLAGNRTQVNRSASFGIHFVVLSCLATAALVPSEAQSQDTPDYFRQNCANCHTIGGGQLTGPDLKDVSKRKDDEWLIEFMLDPGSKLDSNDPYALKLYEESRKVRMPPIPQGTRQRAENLLKLIAAESKKEKSQFKGLKISNKPFTDKNRKHGRDLFQGDQRLANGGAACISCHSMHDTPALGGGRLGPDLTKIYERLKDRKSISAWLNEPPTETMRPIFKDHRLTEDEIRDLVAYFEASAGKSPSEPSANRIAFLLLGLAGAALMVFGFDAIWKRRFHSVRGPLVDTNSLLKNHNR